MVRIPTHRPPPHPGEMLLEEFLLPLGITQRELADAIYVPYQRINEIVNGRRGVTPATALRLSRFFDMSPDFWLNLQLRWDLYQAQQTEGPALMAIQPRRPAAELPTPTGAQLPTGFAPSATVTPERPRMDHTPAQQRAGLDHERAKSQEGYARFGVLRKNTKTTNPASTRLRDLRAQRLRDPSRLRAPNFRPNGHG
jgi:addiction module HigA family antidote